MKSHILVREKVNEILCDAGCSEDFIHQFLSVMESGSIKEQLRLLRIQRNQQLERLHLEEKHLDILDYLRYQMELQAKTDEPIKAAQ